MAIPGNHEYFFDYREWMREYERLGLRTLLNRHVIVERDRAKLVIAGVTDGSTGHSGNVLPDLAAAILDAPREAPIILLDHQPMRAEQAAKMGARAPAIRTHSWHYGRRPCQHRGAIE